MALWVHRSSREATTKLFGCRDQRVRANQHAYLGAEIVVKGSHQIFLSAGSLHESQPASLLNVEIAVRGSHKTSWVQGSPRKRQPTKFT